MKPPITPSCACPGLPAESGLETESGHETAIRHVQAITAAEKKEELTNARQNDPGRGYADHFERQKSRRGQKTSVGLTARYQWWLQMVTLPLRLSLFFNTLHSALSHLKFSHFLRALPSPLSVSLSVSLWPPDSSHHQHPIKDNFYLRKGPDEDPRFSTLLLEAD